MVPVAGIPDKDVFCEAHMPSERHLGNPWSLVVGLFSVPEDFTPQPLRKEDRELKLFDTEKRLQGIAQTDSTLYDAYGYYRGKIADMDQEACRVENRNRSIVVFVNLKGRIWSWNGSLGRVDPGNGLVYKHTGSGRPIGIIGKVSPLGEIYRMGALASLLLSPFQMGA